MGNAPVHKQVGSFIQPQGCRNINIGKAIGNSAYQHGFLAQPLACDYLAHASP
jgi:hypothetical protein